MNICEHLWIKRGYDPQIYTNLGKGNFVVHPVEVNESVRSNTVKEESGFDVIPLKLIAVQDRNRHNTPVYAYGVCKVFVLCEIIGGEFEANIETVQRDFFDISSLPSPLATEKNNKEQIKLCFQAFRSENWSTVFD
ncbi:MAG: hypothetical protein LBE04_06800 [Prevotellaceae bacterium]|nr:hypothetical protein [Prevotellaceae bacterium]